MNSNKLNNIVQEGNDKDLKQLLLNISKKPYYNQYKNKGQEANLNRNKTDDKQSNLTTYQMTKTSELKTNTYRESYKNK